VDTIVKVAIGVALGLALYFNSSEIMAVGGSILAVVGLLGALVLVGFLVVKGYRWCVDLIPTSLSDKSVKRRTEKQRKALGYDE
jgi:hypothetical protein